MTLRRLNASVLSPLLLFPIAWGLTALLAQFHLLHIQDAWSSVMVAVVIAVPLSFVAGGLIGEGVALATTAIAATHSRTQISERTFRLILIAIVAVGLLEVAHQIARAGTIPLLSGSIDDARFSQGGPTILLTNLLTVAAIVALTKPRDLLARDARFELLIAAVAIGAFGLQAGRGSVVLPIVVAIVARWLYWGRPSPYLLLAGALFAFLAVCFGFYLRTYQHPTTPFEAELFGEVLPPLPFILKPLIPVYLALTTNFVALQGVVNHFPTAAAFGHGVYDLVALDNFASGAQHIGNVSGELTPPWVTSTVAGAFWADGGFAVLVPGVALTGALAAGAYAAAARTLSFRWCLVAAYLLYVAIFGLYTNLWTQQIEWLVVTPLLLVFGAFAEDPKAPPGIVGAAWGKIRRVQVRQPKPPEAAPQPAAAQQEPTSPNEPRRGVRTAILSGLAVLAVVLVAGLVIQRTLPEPFALTRAMPLPASVADADAVFTDSQRLSENTPIWWITHSGRTAELHSFDLTTERSEIQARFPSPSGPGTVDFDIGYWTPLRVPALFEIRQAPKRLYVTVRRSDSGRAIGAYSTPIEAPEPGLDRSFAIASFDEPRSDLVIVNRGLTTSRARIGILSGESGFESRAFGTYLPFRGVRPNRWSLEIGELAGKTLENGEQAKPRPDVILVERDPGREHANLKVIPGEEAFEGFAYQRGHRRARRPAADQDLPAGLLAGRALALRGGPRRTRWAAAEDLRHPGAGGIPIEPRGDAEQFEAAQPAEPAPLGVTAARGVGVLVGRTLVLQLLTAGVTVVLARILTPADYGLFAVALAVQMVGQRAAELGLPAALVRLEQDPSPQVQSAVAGVMLMIATALSGLLLLVAFVAVPLAGGASETLEVIAVAGAAMPFYAARAMPMVLMERKLAFGRVALVETADTLAFNGFALLAALAGLGAFSLSGGVPAGALAGVVAAWAIQPFARRPTLDLGPVRPLAGFGLRISLLQGIYLLRELGFVGIVAAIGGAPVAGFYSMAKRLFSFPIALTSAVARVAFPALSRDAELRPRRAAQIATYTAIVAGLPLALVAGAAEPLIDVLLGDEWLPTADLVLAGSLAMLLTASANATLVSAFMAEGSAGYPLASAITELLVVFALAALLTASMGETGVGLALTVSTVIATLVLAIGADPQVRHSLLSVAKSAAIAAVAVAASQAANLANDLEGLLISSAIVVAVWGLLELAFSRADLVRIVRLARPLLRRSAPA